MPLPASGDAAHGRAGCLSRIHAEASAATPSRASATVMAR